MKPALLIDTSYWISVLWDQDTNHEKALRIARAVQNKYVLFTSEDVLKETLTVLSQRLGKKSVQKAYRAICEQCEIVHTSSEDFEMSLEIFFSLSKKDVSLIDCELAHHFQKEGYDALLTFDKHFSSLGCSIFRSPS